MLDHPALGTVLLNTVVWVVAVVAADGAGQPGGGAVPVARTSSAARFVRWAIIVPWAASLVITARLFTLIYDYYHGILNSC